MIKGLVDPNEPQFRSPQLLMVSGVGPQDALVQHNISVLADRPGVGQNMWVCDEPSDGCCFSTSSAPLDNALI